MTGTLKVTPEELRSTAGSGSGDQSKCLVGCFICLLFE